MPRPKLLVFDLDGTLIDSRVDLAHSVNAVLTSLGKDPIPMEGVVPFIGDGAENLIRRALISTGFSSEETLAMLPDLMPVFLEDYHRNCVVHTSIYPGVLPMLERLANFQKAVLTNKPARHTVKILEGLSLIRHFDLIVGGDGPHGKKPDPAGFRYILSSLNATPEEAWMIGDGMQDFNVAKTVGCQFVAFLEGIGDPVALKAAAPDHAIHGMDELVTLLAAEEKS